MKARGLLLVVTLLGCGAPESGIPSSSPLLAMDSDRLWVLLQAAKVNPRCRELYAGSKDPRITGLAEKCAQAELRSLAWLSSNGVADVRAEHLREPEFWQWYMLQAERIQSCQQIAKPGTATFWSEVHSCDPYERITRVDNESLADAGYREPKD
jgi:hypothetical protein